MRYGRGAFAATFASTCFLAMLRIAPRALLPLRYTGRAGRTMTNLMFFT
jgi:hypothetical protein